jgi:MFS transporter, UMF1 family
MGIYGVIMFAGIYAQQLFSFDTGGTVKLFIVTQLSALAGALAGGRAGRLLGCVRAISASLVVWMLVCVVAFFGRTMLSFWIAALLAGFAMGASLPATRALVGRFTPPARSAEFFGLWGQGARLAAIAGTLLHGVVISAYGLRGGIVFFGSTFVIGWILLRRVDESAGIREAAVEAALASARAPTLPG